MYAITCRVFGRDTMPIGGRPGLLRELPLPVVAKALPVPADDGLGLHDHEVFLPLPEDATDPDPEDAVAVLEPCCGRAFSSACHDNQLQDRLAVGCAIAGPI